MAPPDDQRGGGDVLSSLPSTRPQRRSARRSRVAKAADPAAATTRAPARARPARTAGARAKRASAKRPKPKAVRPSAATKRAREPGRSTTAAEPAAPPPAPPEGIALVGTAVQAAGELAQLGLTLGAQAVRGALSRLPRP